MNIDDIIKDKCRNLIDNQCYKYFSSHPLQAAVGLKVITVELASISCPLFWSRQGSSIGAKELIFTDEERLMFQSLQEFCNSYLESLGKSRLPVLFLTPLMLQHRKNTNVSESDSFRLNEGKVDDLLSKAQKKNKKKKKKKANPPKGNDNDVIHDDLGNEDKNDSDQESCREKHSKGIIEVNLNANPNEDREGFNDTRVSHSDISSQPAIASLSGLSSTPVPEIEGKFSLDRAVLATKPTSQEILEKFLQQQCSLELRCRERLLDQLEKTVNRVECWNEHTKDDINQWVFSLTQDYEDELQRQRDIFSETIQSLQMRLYLTENELYSLQEKKSFS